MNRILRILSVAVLLGALTLPAAAANRLPGPEKLTLKNGITVYYHKNAELPLVSFRMWIPGAGLGNEPAALDARGIQQRLRSTRDEQTKCDHHIHQGPGHCDD